MSSTLPSAATLQDAMTPKSPRDDQASFRYFLNEQTKLMVALQELQSEIHALLEFRDLVMDTFPQLSQKLATIQSSLSPTKWEPGIRVKRKLGHHLREPDYSVPSLPPRYRSNSHSKGSSSANSSAGIQDSGFCTESNKEHSSAISGQDRIKNCATEDDLYSLLDRIHSKSVRLKLEVQQLYSRHHQSSSDPNRRRCKSLDDLKITNYSPQCPTLNGTLKSAFLELELNDLKCERDTLVKKMSHMESEYGANLAETNRLNLELKTISSEKHNGEERLQRALITSLHNWRPAVKEQLQVFSDGTLEGDRPQNPVPKEFDDLSLASNLASTKDFNEQTTESRFEYRSQHAHSIEPNHNGVTLSKYTVLNILNEQDPTTLRRFLLTLSYQLEALNAHLQRVSLSRLNVFQQLNRFKAENKHLKFRLEEKSIQLEGTKAKVRVLERMRNEKLSHSTSDLMVASPRDDTRFTCHVSDTAFMVGKMEPPMRMSSRCADLRNTRDRKNGQSRRCTSKIPLKTSAKSSSSPADVKTTSTSGSNSCISYTCTSLYNE